MWRQFYAALPWPWAPQLAMALFIGAFAFVLLRTYLANRPADYAPLAALPLGDDAASTPALKEAP